MIKLSDPELDAFIKDSIKAGKTPDEVKSILLEAGWDEKRIESTFGHYYPANYPVAVPRPKPFVSPRLFFLNAFYFLTLYLTAYNTVSILFTIIDTYLPDDLARGAYYQNPLEDNIAIILICAPMIYITQHTIMKAMQNTKQAVPRIRLIMVYLTMFLVGCVMLINSSLFVYYLLSGELSTRFILKLAILMTIAIGLYFYYRGELKHDEENA